MPRLLPTVLRLLRTAALPLLLSLGAPGAAAAQAAEGGQPPTIDLPAEFDRVLRDYESAWRAGDEAALAALFAEDGFILRPGQQPVRGRAAIERAYRSSGGPLYLRALAYEVSGPVGYIIGGYRGRPDGTDGGKFVLALKLGADGRWLIAADMDNHNGG